MAEWLCCPRSVLHACTSVSRCPLHRDAIVLIRTTSWQRDLTVTNTSRRTPFLIRVLAGVLAARAPQFDHGGHNRPLRPADLGAEAVGLPWTGAGVTWTTTCPSLRYSGGAQTPGPAYRRSPGLIFPGVHSLLFAVDVWNSVHVSLQGRGQAARCLRGSLHEVPGWGCLLQTIYLICFSKRKPKTVKASGPGPQKKPEGGGSHAA